MRITGVYKQKNKTYPRKHNQIYIKAHYMPSINIPNLIFHFLKLTKNALYHKKAFVDALPGRKPAKIALPDKVG